MSETPKKVPQVVVRERQTQYEERLRELLENDDIFRMPTEPVRLKDGEYWFPYWANSEIHPHRIEALKRLGYEPVRVADLDCTLTDIGANESPDGYVTSGPRGQELLMRCPKWYHEERQRRKVAKTNEMTFGRQRAKDELLGHLAKARDAGQFVKLGEVSIKDSRELE